MDTTKENVDKMIP